MRSVLLHLLALFALACSASAHADDGFAVVQDPKTRAKIALPLKLLPAEQETKLGRRWMSRDGSLKVDLFSLKPKTVLEVYENVKGVKGRKALRDEAKSNSFILEGYDEDGSQFYVEGHQTADSVTGFSVVYAKSRAKSFQPLIKRIAESFEPAGTGATGNQITTTAATLHAWDLKSGMRLQVHGVNKGDRLNVRAFANAKSAIIAELPDQTADLLATGRTRQNDDDIWVEVARGNRRGWVNSRFIRMYQKAATIQARGHDVPTETKTRPSEEKLPPSVDHIADCNSDDRDRKLRGCEVLIQKSDLPPQTRALALSRRADSYLALGDFEHSILDLTEADRLQTDDHTRKRLSFAYYLRGLSRSRTNNHDEAITDFGQAISIDAKNDQAFIARASAYADHARLDDAIADLSNWLNFGNNSSDVKNLLADLYQRRAVMRLGEKQYTSAAEDCTAAINLVPERLELYLIRASVRLAHQDTTSAIADSDLVLAKEPNHLKALVLRGEARGMAADYRGAAEDYTLVLGAQPKNTSVLLLRALIYERLEKFSDAEADYTRVVRLEPKNEIARRSLKRLSAFVKWRRPKF